MSESFQFAPETSVPETHNPEPWKLLIVDDDTSIHTVTMLALKDLVFKNKPITFTSTYSAEETIETLKKENAFTVVLLDIGMETSDAGLEVAKYIRENLHDLITRIIIRTGQTGNIPERQIIDEYDINDFKSKTDLTHEKLFTTIRTALSQYDQINELQQLNTELEKRIQEALSKQQKQQEALFLHNRSIQMAEMLNILAHQWRQPLSRISAVTAQLKLSLALDELDKDAFEKQIDHIEFYTQDLSSTIDEFRELYEPVEENKKITVDKLITKSISIVKEHFNSHNIEIVYTPDAILHNMLVSPELYQVLMSLFNNTQDAFHLSKTASGQITLSLSQNDRCLGIHLQDNAGGVPEEHLEKIFEPYYSTKSAKHGHGLGLYMSKNIVEKHCDGRIEVENRDGGARFSIYLNREH